ncbi:hypothetical protein VTJ83DRAFT_6804, partial [Remersonia thermophila]
MDPQQQAWPGWQMPPPPQASFPNSHPPPPPPPLAAAAVTAATGAFPSNAVPCQFQPPPPPARGPNPATVETDVSDDDDDESVHESNGDRNRTGQNPKPMPSSGRPMSLGTLPPPMRAAGPPGIPTPPDSPGKKGFNLAAPLSSSAARPQPSGPAAQGQHHQPPFPPPQGPGSSGARTQPGMRWNEAASPPQQRPASARSPPRGPGARAASSRETSASMDRKWGVLFDHEDKPTKRWAEVAQGIGKYMMDEFIPLRTLVITPSKMNALYGDFKLEQEAIPFADLFRPLRSAAAAHAHLEALYQSLGLEYFLVPPAPGERPTLPGLTLSGWEGWLTLCVSAYPAEEAARLARVVAALPVVARPLPTASRSACRRASRGICCRRRGGGARGTICGRAWARRLPWRPGGGKGRGLLPPLPPRRPRRPRRARRARGTGTAPPPPPPPLLLLLRLVEIASVSVSATALETANVRAPGTPTPTASDSRRAGIRLLLHLLPLSTERETSGRGTDTRAGPAIGPRQIRFKSTKHNHHRHRDGLANPAAGAPSPASPPQRLVPNAGRAGSTCCRDPRCGRGTGSEIENDISRKGPTGGGMAAGRIGIGSESGIGSERGGGSRTATAADPSVSWIGSGRPSSELMSERAEGSGTGTGFASRPDGGLRRWLGIRNAGAASAGVAAVAAMSRGECRRD